MLTISMVVTVPIIRSGMGAPGIGRYQPHSRKVSLSMIEALCGAGAIDRVALINDAACSLRHRQLDEPTLLQFLKCYSAIHFLGMVVKSSVFQPSRPQTSRAHALRMSSASPCIRARMGDNLASKNSWPGMSMLHARARRRWCSAKI